MSKGITDEQRAALASLAPALDAETYLAGGVAIALAMHHRMSVDLDLFVAHDFDADRLAERLASSTPSLRVVGRAPGTLHAEVSDIPVSILSYRYPLLAPTRSVPDLPVRVASLEDLVCMKIAAIAGRGAAKDFWDLHTLLARGVVGDLGRVLELYQRKFPTDDVGHVIRSLAYFGDADAAPLPRGLTSQRWGEIKAAIAKGVRSL